MKSINQEGYGVNPWRRDGICRYVFGIGDDLLEGGHNVDPIPHPPKKQHFHSILLRKTISFTEAIN
jgi:hypothetical protein